MLDAREVNNIGCTCGLSLGRCSGLCQLPEWEGAEETAYVLADYIEEDGMPVWLEDTVDEFEDRFGLDEPFDGAICPGDGCPHCYRNPQVEGVTDMPDDWFEPFNIGACWIFPGVWMALDRDYNGFALVVSIYEYGRLIRQYEYKQIPYSLVDRAVWLLASFEMMGHYKETVTAEEVRGLISYLADEAGGCEMEV